MIIVMELTNDFQLVIPEPVRELLGLRAGDWIAFEKQDDKVSISKFKKERVEDHHALKSVQGLDLRKAWIAFGATGEKIHLHRYFAENEDSEDWEDDEVRDSIG